MKIGIILYPYNKEKQSGLGRYSWEMTKHIIENDSINEYVIFLKNKAKEAPVFNGDNYIIKVIGKKYFWLDRGLYGQKLDVCLFFTPVMPFFVKFKKAIITVHDLGYKYIKSTKVKGKMIHFLMHWIYKLSINKASHIVAVSRETKKDILNFFNVSENKIRVVYNGINKLPKAFEMKTPNNFFLFVGSVKRRKNVFRLVEAFIIFKKNNFNDVKLIIAGKSGGGKYYESIVREIDKNKLNNDVLFTGFIKDEQLSFLYEKAIALVYPSLLEGFGLPILEAMYSKLPVITSNYGALKEVSGGATLLINPNSSIDLSNAMNKIYSNIPFRDYLIGKGLERLKMFSWDKAAKEVLEIINN